MPFVQMNLIKAPYSLQFWRQGTSNETLPIKYVTLNEFHYVIRQALSNQHSISKFEWDEKSKAYKVEYGTRPLEYDNIECAGIIQRKRFVSQLAGIEALKRFPHNQNHLDFDDFDLMPLTLDDLPRKWSKFEIRLYWNHQENCLQIGFQRLTGDRSSYFDVWRNFKRYFMEIEITQSNLREALLEANTIGDITEGYLRDYLVCDLV